jgi:hypothetical protein
MRRIILLLILLAPLTAYSQARILSLQEIATSAGVIFQGTVTKVRSAADKNGDIVTYTTFKVEKPVAGTSKKSYTVKQLGGEVNGIATQIADMHYFQPGEHIVVALYKPSTIGMSSPVGLYQGVWHLSKDAKRVEIPATQLQTLPEASRSDLKIQGSLTNAQVVDRSKFISLLKDLRKGVAQ